MKEIISVAAPAVTSLALAASAHADNDSGAGGGVHAANDWNFAASAVCFQEPAVVPVGRPWTGDPACRS